MVGSFHAAGVVITPEPVTNYVPLYRTTRDEIVTQFAMKEVEKAGLVTRAPSPDDERGITVTITDAGRARQGRGGL